MIWKKELIDVKFIMSVSSFCFEEILPKYKIWEMVMERHVIEIK